jgi:hypothetical protein
VVFLAQTGNQNVENGPNTIRVSYKKSSETPTSFPLAELKAGPSPEKSGGLNGSMQHLLDDSLKEPGKLISCVGINPNKSKALFRF